MHVPSTLNQAPQADPGHTSSGGSDEKRVFVPMVSKAESRGTKKNTIDHKLARSPSPTPAPPRASTFRRRPSRPISPSARPPRQRPASRTPDLIDFIHPSIHPSIHPKVFHPKAKKQFSRRILYDAVCTRPSAEMERAAASMATPVGVSWGGKNQLARAPDRTFKAEARSCSARSTRPQGGSQKERHLYAGQTHEPPDVCVLLHSSILLAHWCT